MDVEYYGLRINRIKKVKKFYFDVSLHFVLNLRAMRGSYWFYNDLHVYVQCLQKLFDCFLYINFTVGYLVSLVFE